MISPCSVRHEKDEEDEQDEEEHEIDTTPLWFTPIAYSVVQTTKLSIPLRLFDRPACGTLDS